MNKQLLGTIWIEGLMHFSVPFLITLASALSPYALADSAQPGMIGWIVILCSPLVAGMSALKSFLSTTVADAKDELASAKTLSATLNAPEPQKTEPPPTAPVSAAPAAVQSTSTNHEK